MTRERNAIDSLGDLFGSKARALVLAALASAGGEDVTASEVARQQGITVQEAAKQLHLLEGIGLLGSERRGRLKPYSVNEDYPIWPELRRMMLKTLGAGGMIASALSDLPIRVAFIFVSVAQGEDTIESDIDLMVIGEVGMRQLSGALRELQRELGREVNPVLHTTEEFARGVAGRKPFLMSVMRGDKIFVIGDEDELRAITGAGKHTGAQADG